MEVITCLWFPALRLQATWFSNLAKTLQPAIYEKSLNLTIGDLTRSVTCGCKQY